MTTLRASRLATEISGQMVSESKIRRLCKSGAISSTFESGRYFVDENSLRSYFS